MKNKQLFWILLIVGCSVFALLGILHHGFFVSDDGHWMIIRLSAFYEGLSSGQFPIRFLPRLNQGLGYPVADFLYPLFLYIGSILHIIRIPYILDIKILLGGSIILSGVGMYLFLRQLFRDFSSFLGAVVYMYLPYHLYDVYARGSVGEVLSLAIVPFLFWAIEKKSWILLGALLGFLITSHNTLALFFLPVVIAYAYLRAIKLAHIFFAVSLGLGLSSFFWIPALYDRQFTIFNSVVVSNPSNYFINVVGYSLVGWIALAVFGGVIVARGVLKDRAVLFFTILGIISLFFSSSLSSFFWQNKYLLQFVQFPFRFLSLTLIAESFLSAYLVQKFNNKIIPSIILLLLLGFSSWPYIFPKQFDTHPDSFYATNLATTTVQNEYMPKWVQKIPMAYYGQKVFIGQKSGKVEHVVYKGTKLSFTASMMRESDVRIGYDYFPGWKVTIDGKPVEITPSNTGGLIQFTIPNGVHTIVASYEETEIHLLADAVSIISIGFLSLYFFKKRFS